MDFVASTSNDLLSFVQLFSFTRAKHGQTVTPVLSDELLVLPQRVNDSTLNVDRRAFNQLCECR